MKKKWFRKRHKNIQHQHVVVALLLISLATALTSVAIIGIVQRNVTSYVHLAAPARFDAVGSKIFTPGDGRQYVIVDIEVLNPTTHVFYFAPVVQTYIADEKGHRYDMAPTELKNPIMAGDMKPGETRRGELSYNAPLSATRLYFNFESGSSDTVTSRIQIK